MLKQVLLLVCFSFYKVGAEFNDNLLRVRRYALRFVSIFNILVLANLAAFVSAVCHVALFAYPLPLLVIIGLPQLLLSRFLFGDTNWQRTFTKLDTLPFASKMGLSTFFFGSLPALWCLLLYQAVTSSGRPFHF